MELLTFPLGPLQTNCYLLAGEREAVAVDPGGNPAPLLDHLKAHGLALAHILLTHLHFDHTYGARALAEATGAPLLCSRDDKELLGNWLGMGGDMGLPPVDEYVPSFIEPGAHRFGGFDCTVFATPGHSRGSLTFHFPEAGAAFVGDLIFYRSIGRTDFPGGDLDALRRSVRERIFTLPPETVLYPGHGPATTAGEEHLHNPYFQGE